MKRYQKYPVLAGLALLAVACIKIVSVIHPETAPVNSEVEVTLNVEIEPADSNGGNILFGILAPEAWNLSENAQVTYTSDNSDGVKTMRVASATETAPSGKPWTVSLRDSLGTHGNYEPVEWIPFIADDHLPWQNQVKFNGVITVRFSTGADNLKTRLAYVVSNVKDAADVDVRAVFTQVFETTDGDNATIDYTQPKVCSITPETFTWEDIVALHCDLSIQIDGVDSPLKGADKVYLMARATYNDGTQEAVVDVVGSKTLMKSEGADKWVIYLYPHEFFDIPAGVTIENVGFYFVNEDKSLEAKGGGGSEFSIAENNR